MAKSFQTPAWQRIRDPNSDLNQFLLDNVGHSKNNCLDFRKMMIIGLLYTVDRRNGCAKGTEFFNLLQEGGADHQEYINARDKDWIPVLNQMFATATAIAVRGSG